MTCMHCGHDYSFHNSEGCFHQVSGRYCPCTSTPSQPEDTMPTSPPQTCTHCGHSNLAHTAFGNCLACVPGREGHDCRAVLVHEFVHAARTKYERLEVELGDALDELELLKKRYTALQDKQTKVTWHIERAAGRLEEALEELGQGGEE